LIDILIDQRPPVKIALGGRPGRADQPGGWWILMTLSEDDTTRPGRIDLNNASSSSMAG